MLVPCLAICLWPSMGSRTSNSTPPNFHRFGYSSRSSLLLPTPVTPMFLAPPTKASWIDLGPGRKADPGVGGGSHVYTCEARDYLETSPYEGEGYFGDQASPAKRGRPRKHAPKVPLPPLYVFIR